MRVLKKGLTEEEIQETKKEIENGNIRNQEDVDSWTEEHLDKQGRDISVNVDAEIRKTNGGDALVDSRPPQGEPIGELSDSSSKENLGTGQVRTGYDGTNAPRYVDIDDVTLFLL